MDSTTTETGCLFRQVNTRDAGALCDAVLSLSREFYCSPRLQSLAEELFWEATGIFDGRFAHFQRMNMRYHDLEHTLQATLCWCLLLRRYQEHGNGIAISETAFLNGLAAVLLHDIGYLKEANDFCGTGAKFIFVHEQRSCELAQIFLARYGWEPSRIHVVQQMIRCTGPHAAIPAIRFSDATSQLLGKMLCTADFLGQMADPHYLEKLPVLFQEFKESDDYHGVPPGQRMFSSLEQLIAETPAFWYNRVLPKLEFDCDGLYRYLAVPYPDGPNSYLDAIHANLDRVNTVLSS